MIREFYNAELDTAAATADKRRAMNIQEQQFNSQLDETTRRFNEQMGLEKDKLNAGTVAGLTSSAVQLPIAGMAGYKLYKSLGGALKKTPGNNVPSNYTEEMGIEDPTATPGDQFTDTTGGNYDYQPMETSSDYPPSDFSGYNYDGATQAGPVELSGSYTAGTPEESNAMKGMTAQAEPQSAVELPSTFGMGTTIGYAGARQAGSQAGLNVAQGIAGGTDPVGTTGTLEAQGYYWDPSTHSVNALSDFGGGGGELPVSTYGVESAAPEAMLDAMSPEVGAAVGAEAGSSYLPYVGPAITAGKIGYDLIQGDYDKAVDDTPIVSGYAGAEKDYEQGNWGSGSVKALGAPFMINKIPGGNAAMETVGNFFQDTVSNVIDDISDWF